MDYSFSGLGPREFEHLSQALAMKVLGPHLSVFGDGKDGGREAAWHGPTPSLGDSATWDGYGILQAKFRQHTGSPVENLAWISSQLKTELGDWAASPTRKDNQPDFALFVTNVRLSAAVGGGKDQIKSVARARIEELGLAITDFRVWDYDDLRALIDDAPGIRDAYLAWLTPGDLISQLISVQRREKLDFDDALEAQAARSFHDDHYLNLRQSGSVSDQPVSLADVLIDLPSTGGLAAVRRRRGFRSDIAPSAGVVQNLISLADLAPALTEDEWNQKSRHRRIVLIGGPGQGKSTVTQTLAQMYRAAFLDSSATAAQPELGAELNALKERLERLGLALPSARRWPIRIILTDLADALDAEPELSLITYIARQIVRRSSFLVDQRATRDWLNSYPWLLLIDGLDEVPASSNRSQVMQCLHDFFLEVARLRADVMTVATTRPQGYSNEFDPEYYAHWSLLPLPRETALEYARGFVAIRSGKNSDNYLRVMERMEAASLEETTQRLFTSPLQVTIMTVLLEKLGRVPRDRWKLFSEYYRVISQREQEKSGELAQLLQTYSGDVDFIHRQIGNLLQERSAGAGETSASLGRSEFERIIRDRLTQQEHPASEVDRLTTRLLTLATDRLVFLAYLSAETVGFEIRSLQEFMAGEFLVSLPEADAVQGIRDVALLAHWRNAVLFAAGYVFANRDYLKAEIVTICADLDLHGPENKLIRPGADLALDILLDGSAASQPRFARPLAERACALMEGPVNSRVGDLGRYTEGEAGDIIRERANSTAPARASVWINRVIAIDGSSAAGNDRSVEQMQQLAIAAPVQVQRALAEMVWTRERPTFTSAFTDLVWKFSPAHFVKYIERTSQQFGQPDNATILDTVQQLLSNGHGYDMEIDGLMDSRIDLGVRIRSIGSYSAASIETESFSREQPGWALLAKMVSFGREPSKIALAETLELAASSPGDWSILQHGPWPLASVYESACYLSKAADAGIDAALVAMASAARAGEFLDTDDWLSLERAWRLMSPASMTGEAPTFAPIAGISWDIPIFAQLSDEVQVLGTGFMLTGGTSEERDPALAVAEQLLQQSLGERSARRAALFELGLFVLSLVNDKDEDIDGSSGVGAASESAGPRTASPIEPERLERILALVEECMAKEPLRSDSTCWTKWASLYAEPDGRISERALLILKRLGGWPKIAQTRDDRLAAMLLKSVGSHEDSWGLLRIALHHDPSTAKSFPLPRTEIELGSKQGRVGALGLIAQASEESILSGSLDEHMVSLRRTDLDSVDNRFIYSLAASAAATGRTALAARASEVFADLEPAFSSGLFELAHNAMRSVTGGQLD